MMPEQFDALACALARGLSRRDFSKLLLLSLAGGATASVLSACNSNSEPQVVPQPCPPPFPPNPSDNEIPASVTCAQADYYIANTGVGWFKRDPNWPTLPPNQQFSLQHEKTADGATLTTFCLSFTPFVPMYTQNANGSWAASSPQLDIMFDDRQEVDKLSWDGSTNNVIDPTACKAAYDQWKAYVDEHEKHHADDDLDIVARTRNLQPQLMSGKVCYNGNVSYQGTGPTKDAARNSLQKLVTTDILKCMNDERDLRATDWDDQNPYQDLPCDKCIPICDLSYQQRCPDNHCCPSSGWKCCSNTCCPSDYSCCMGGNQYHDYHCCPPTFGKLSVSCCSADGDCSYLHPNNICPK